MLWAASMVAAFLLLLSLLHCPGKLHSEFLAHTLITSGSLFSAPSSLLALSSSKHATCTAWVLAGWMPFSFCKREKGLLPCACLYHQQSSYKMVPLLFFLSLPHCLEIIRVHLFVGAGLQVGYHCFEPFKQSTVKGSYFSLAMWSGGKCSRNNITRN